MIDLTLKKTARELVNYAMDKPDGTLLEKRLAAALEEALDEVAGLKEEQNRAEQP